MFEHVVLRRAEGGSPVTAGQIAESLLYYQKVHVVIDRGTLFQLVKQIGIDHLKLLLKRPELSAVYCEENLATHTKSVGVTQFHDYLAFSLGGDQATKLNSPEERTAYELERQGTPRKVAREFSKWFTNRVPMRKYTGNHFVKGGIPAAARRDLSDAEFVRDAVRQAIAALSEGRTVDDSLHFELMHTEQGYCAFSNIDFDAINTRRAAMVPPLDPVTVAYLLSNILDARADLAMASYYGGDFVTSAVTSAIIRTRYSEVLRRSQLNLESRQQFVDVVLPDAPSLSEAIDAGERSIDDFFRLLDKGGRFKSWLGAVNPDENLVRAYIREITSEPSIQGTVAKTLRYALTTALGFVNPVAGLVAGGADSFVVDKLFSGWRPNHFVVKKLLPFVRGY
ncbi:hypothetical protein [Paraburkholderia solisilvae]|uniref:Uncharacterized protein n=1 Tax=Paraburkholderia solisilvae TaxID=624376 RepID=A0A6J5EUC9_9BURK|nr:hypothetical protein [Paraburkholderia solisilvae]CAB3768981.1 hypothetical protein LMG29739_05426 [Paraburkholderia solisilvae]